MGEDIYDEEDGKTIEELLAELGPEEDWNLNPDDPGEIQRLLDEAKKVLPVECRTTKEQMKVDSAPTGATSNLGKFSNTQPSSIEGTSTSTPKEEIHPEATLTEDQEADVYLQQILDELSFSPPDPASAEDQRACNDINPAQSPLNCSTSPPSDSHFPSTPTSLHALPATPSMIRSSPPGSQNPLFLPSAPTALPTYRPVRKAASSKPNIPDEEVESWCIICNEDATVRCLGCEGDLYCKACWQEGHEKEVGLEERSHRWVRYKRG